MQCNLKISMWKYIEITAHRALLNFWSQLFNITVKVKSMKNQQNPNPKQFNKNEDAGSYTLHAEDYYQNEIILAKPFAKKMMQIAHITPDQKVLDVGTGPGILAFQVASNLSGNGTITGVDLSSDMIKTSQLHAKKNGVSNSKFSIMDAENLEFTDNEFDSVISMRTMHHIPNVDKALNEIMRVLKPGGGFSISIGSRIPPWRHGRLKSYATAITRELKSKINSDLIAPNFITRLSSKLLHEIPEPVHTSWGGHEPEKTLLKHIKKAGFLIENTQWLYNIVPITSVDEFWKYQLAVVTEVRKRYQSANPGLQKIFKNEFYRQSKRALENNKQLYYCASLFAIGGRKAQY